MKRGESKRKRKGEEGGTQGRKGEKRKEGNNGGKEGGKGEIEIKDF